MQSILLRQPALKPGAPRALRLSLQPSRRSRQRMLRCGLVAPQQQVCLRTVHPNQPPALDPDNLRMSACTADLRSPS